MSEKLTIGPINKGLRTDREPFVIDDDSFPTLINAYQWRGRLRRKRGTTLACRLQRFFDSTISSYSSVATIKLSSGSANLLSGFISLEADASLVLGSIIITDLTSGNTYTDDSLGSLIGSPAGSGTVNYSTGAITIVGGASDTISVSFLYYPTLPVMGLEDIELTATQFPGTIAFDTTYAYNITTASYPYASYDISFYSNPPTGTYSGYIAKSSPTPVSWNGENYQQFWTTNYSGAFWATNGLSVPITNLGMQYASSTSITYVSNTATTIVLTIKNCPLEIGDFVFLNEFLGTGTPDTTSSTLNLQSGYVIAISGSYVSLTVTIKLPDANVSVDTYTEGMVQYLTNRSDDTKDCLRWYDGDPTDGNVTSPSFSPSGLGWVNFCPPICQKAFSIADLPPRIYYLIGAKIIYPFKDRIIFLGVVVQASGGSPIYLQDTIVYSQNGTPYYTASFQGDPRDPTSISSILVPSNQTGSPASFLSDSTGFGGFISAGLLQPIISVGRNEDVLIVGFSQLQTRLIYTGNDIVPFNFFVINSELGTSSTFSSVIMDQGVITKGNRGFIITAQTNVQRIDIPILDQVFNINLKDGGNDRICAQRDYDQEWIYFTYRSNEIPYVFPNQTLLYNYRDDTWAIFNENYTTYGSIYPVSGFTWNTVPWTWNGWNSPWSSGTSTILQPQVSAGNQEGFVLIRETASTNEATSLAIKSITGNVVTSPNHCLNNGDYILITGCIGTISSLINGKVFSVSNSTTNTFTLNTFSGSGTYLGGGLITRFYVPMIQSKQFPTAWGLARKTRIGVQRYLFTSTPSSQIILQIFLSQDSYTAYNTGPIVPDPASQNNALIYSQVLFTCPDNYLMSPTSDNQAQIWHRVNTSLIGDTIQFGFTMSDTQMRDPTLINQTAEIEFHAAVLEISPSQMLC